jgi:N-acyl-D-amino-acid deacylase
LHSEASTVSVVVRTRKLEANLDSTVRDFAGARHDIVIRGGWVIDGLGTARRRADVAIVGDRISSIGDLAAHRASLEIDAHGKIVAPGFIDSHAHDDGALIRLPDMAAKTCQGVTTVVAGNCGASLAPLKVDSGLPVPLQLLGNERDFQFDSFGAYVEALETAPAAVNAFLLVGHTTLRRRCMTGGLDRPASDPEILQMQTEVRHAMSEGASGLSSGLDYISAISSSTKEVVALAEVAGELHGVYVTHVRNYFDKADEALTEALDTGRQARVPLIISHHQTTGRRNHGRMGLSLKRIEEAMRVQNVGLDVYPYAATSTVLRPEPDMLDLRVVVTWSQPHPEMIGRELSEIANEWSCERMEAAERLRPGGAVYFQLNETDVQEALSFPHTMIGSDGLPFDQMPHPRLWGTFPRVIGHYARELRLFTVEEAVRRMTGLPAERFGLVDRGSIREGGFADVVVFDPETIIDRATFEHPIREPAGIEHVFVNGERVRANGVSTGARPGRILRRHRDGQSTSVA